MKRTIERPFAPPEPGGYRIWPRRVRFVIGAMSGEAVTAPLDGHRPLSEPVVVPDVCLGDADHPRSVAVPDLFQRIQTLNRPTGVVGGRAGAVLRQPGVAALADQVVDPRGAGVGADLRVDRSGRDEHQAEDPERDDRRGQEGERQPRLERQGGAARARRLARRRHAGGLSGEVAPVVATSR